MSSYLLIGVLKLLDNKGFMSLIAVFVTTIVLIIAITIINLSHMSFLTTNASINGKQAFYLAEGKLHLCMYKEEYFENEVMPRLKHYLLYGDLKNYKEGSVINLKSKDLNDEDSYNKVNIEFFEKDSRLKAKLITSSRYRGIYEKLVGAFNMVNSFYEIELPILSVDSIPTEEVLNFQLFCNELVENIEINNNIADIVPIEGLDFDKVILEEDTEFNDYMAYIFKNGKLEPYKKVPISNNNLFLILRQNDKLKSNLEIKSLSSNEPLNGIVYVQGDIVLYDNVNFCGIIIIEGGTISVKGEGKPKVDGLIILKDYKGNISLLDDLIDKDYNGEQVYRYGPLLPNFVEPDLYLIKNFSEY